MTFDERARATVLALEAQRDKLMAWLAKPSAERQADAYKVQHTIEAHGIVAGRRMMEALGLPIISDELCDSPEVLEACTVQDHNKLYEAGLLKPSGQVDH